MFPLLLFLAVSSPHPCDAGIVRPSRPLTINGQPAVCTQYVAAAVGDASVVVYAIEAVERPNSSDFPHQVFVAFGRRRADNAWKLSDRHDVTAAAALLSSEDIGNFILLDARVDRFTLAGARFVDVGVSTTISGTGGISETKGLLFRIDGGKLLPAATLETEGYARGGVSFLHQITSELLVGKDELVQVKRDRLARGRNQPLTVHCKVSRTVFKLIDGRLERSGEIDASELEGLRPRLRPLPRFDTREIVPCCAGCSITN